MCNILLRTVLDSTGHPRNEHGKRCRMLHALEDATCNTTENAPRVRPVRHACDVSRCSTIGKGRRMRLGIRRADDLFNKKSRAGFRLDIELAEILPNRAQCEKLHTAEKVHG